jgi:hypothetical protein
MGMKYLKKYKVFESDSPLDKIYIELNDICQELKDDGLKFNINITKCSKVNNMLCDDVIKVSVFSDKSAGIKDIFDRIVDYTKPLGYINKLMLYNEDNKLSLSSFNGDINSESEAFQLTVYKSVDHIIGESKTDQDLILTEIDKINDILLDLIDDKWVVNIDYTPERWLSSSKSDYINIVIKSKQNANQSKYPPDSEFKPSSISDYTLRLIDSYDNDFSIGYCKKDETVYFGKNTGIWERDVSVDILDSNNLVLGIEIKIYLKGENLDNFKSIPLLKRSFNISESKTTPKLKFNKQPRKKGAKTDIYNVVKNGTTIGQVKWYSRLRGYGFLPPAGDEAEVKEFVKEISRLRREENKKNKKK